MNFILQNNYKSVIDNISKTAEKLGVKVYLIGGVVRDLILNTKIKDVDITVEGNAIDFCNYLKKEIDCKIISFQEDLKTAKVKFKNDIVIDFASTREEYYPQAGMMPVAYNFGCELIKDVQRRDFTMNTLAVALNNKYSLIDFYNGLDDIKNKKIKILHKKSFIDDPSRIVRAIKFQMRLSFDIENQTQILMNNYLKNADKTIPLERIKNEIKQYFLIQKPNLYKNLIEKRVHKLIDDNPFTDFDEEIIKEIKIKDKWFMYFIMLIFNSQDMGRLNLTASVKRTIEEVKELLKNPLGKDKFQIYKAFIKKTDLTPYVYYVITQDKSALDFVNEYKKIKLLINGDDLIEKGFKPSKQFGELFNRILNEKLNGKLQTKEEELNYAVLSLTSNLK